MADEESKVHVLRAVPADDALCRGAVVILTCDLKAECPMTIRRPVKGEPGYFLCTWHDVDKSVNEFNFHVEELLILDSMRDEDEEDGELSIQVDLEK